MYLLEETPEAQEMRQNVRRLLISDEESNFELALQLMEASGTPHECLAILCVLALTNALKPSVKDYKKVRRLHQFLMPRLSQEDQNFWQNKLVKNSWEDCLEKIWTQKVFKDFWQEIALLVLEIYGEGKSFCYRHNLLQTGKTLQPYVQKEVLNLSRFGLQDLPDEIAHMDIKELILSGCPLQNLSPPAWQNFQIIRLKLDDIIGRQTIRKLHQYFPNWDTYHFYAENIDELVKKIENARSSGNFEKVYDYARKAHILLRYVPKAHRSSSYYYYQATIYSFVGLHNLANLCYEHIQQNSTTWEQLFYFYDMACNYAQLGNKPKMLKMLALDLSHRPIPKSKYVLIEDGFQMYWQDEDLIKLIKAYNEMDEVGFKAYSEQYLHL